MRRMTAIGAAALVLGVAGAAGAAGAEGAADAAGTAGAAGADAARAVDGTAYFSNPGKTVACRYSSFSGFQELKCSDRRVKGDDGGPLTFRLHKTGKGEELLFDQNPVAKIGSTVARFAKPQFECTLTRAVVRCTNPQKHGFQLKLPRGSVF